MLHEFADGSIRDLNIHDHAVALNQNVIRFVEDQGNGDLIKIIHDLTIDGDDLIAISQTHFHSHGINGDTIFVCLGCRQIAFSPCI